MLLFFLTWPISSLSQRSKTWANFPWRWLTSWAQATTWPGKKPTWQDSTPSQTATTFITVSYQKSGSGGRAVINPKNFPLESNQLAHHQIFSAAVMLNTASSIGRVVQPYHSTVMLVVIHVVVQKTKTRNQEAGITELTPASSAPVWKKCFQKVSSTFLQ